MGIITPFTKPILSTPVTCLVRFPGRWTQDNTIATEMHRAVQVLGPSGTRIISIPHVFITSSARCTVSFFILDVRDEGQGCWGICSKACASGSAPALSHWVTTAKLKGKGYKKRRGSFERGIIQLDNTPSPPKLASRFPFFHLFSKRSSTFSLTLILAHGDVRPFPHPAKFLPFFIFKGQQ